VHVMLGMTAITPATLGGANGRLCTVLLLDAVAQVAACTNLLQNLSHRHVVCATGGALWLGDTRGLIRGGAGDPDAGDHLPRGWFHTRTEVIQIGVA
jgi:hypothetical protein